MWLSVGPLFTSTRFLPPRVQHWQHVVWHSFTAMDSIFYNPKKGTGSYTITSANQTSEWRPSHETSDIILVCNVKIGEKHTEATRRWKCRHFNGWDRRKENYLNEIQELAMGKLKKNKNWKLYGYNHLSYLLRSTHPPLFSFCGGALSGTVTTAFGRPTSQDWFVRELGHTDTVCVYKQIVRERERCIL